MRAATVLLVVMTCLACAPPTAMTIEFSTNLPCPGDRTARYLGVAIGGTEDAVESAFTEIFDANGCDAATGVIGTYSFRPPDGDRSMTVNVRAALSPGGDVEHVCNAQDRLSDPTHCIVARRRVRFTPGAVLRVPINFQESCLGKPCTPNETCVTGGLCVPKDVAAKCSSGSTCQVDLQGCDIAGTHYEAGAAKPGDTCFRCRPAESTTDFSGAACIDDSNGCTTEQCGPAGECLHLAVADGQSCGPGRFCKNAACQQGCVIASVEYPDGTANPNNECEVCDGSRNTAGWSPANEGGACPDEGNTCTSDACTAGTCAHDALPDGTNCGGANICTGGVCSTGCTIGGTFFSEGTVNPANECQRCVTATSTTAWSAVANTTACLDDGNACSDDVCTAGACTHPLKANGVMCGGGQVCTSGSCGTGCVIGGNPFASGITNPANPCQSCQPGVSSTAWSPKVDRTACPADTNACTNDWCVAGVCSHPPTASGSACSGTNYCSGATRHFAFSCDGAGACAAKSTQACATASTCQTGGGCSAGACVAVANKAAGTSCSGVSNGMCCGGSCVNKGLDPNCGICGLNCGSLGCGNSLDFNGVGRSPPQFVCVGVSANAQCTGNYGSAATAFNNQCNCQCASGTSCSPGGKCPVCHDVSGTNYCTY